jgi:hypothetical protein
MTRNEIEIKFQELLQEYGSGDQPRISQARDWYRAGLTWAQVVETCQRGDHLLWAACEIGLLDDAAATACACGCVDRLEGLAHDVCDVTAAMRGRGGRMAARHEVMAVEAITSISDRDISLPDNEPILQADIPGASKARYAAGRLVDGAAHNVLFHAAMAKAADARGAWVQALRDGASKVELKGLEGAADRALVMEQRAQADAVRLAMGAA